MRKRVVITGGTGFVGAGLVRRLLQDGHEVHLLVRPGHATWRITDLLPHLQRHQINLEEASELENLMTRLKPDWIFHLAVHGAYSSQTDVTRIIQTNFLGTVHLVEACLKAGFEAFVNTGSSSEYGFKDHPPNETEVLEPNSHYAVTKAAATQYCHFAAQKYGVHLLTLRLYSVFGPNEEPGRLMPTLIAHGLRGELPPLVNPEIARDYVYLEDVCDAYLFAATIRVAAGAIYNVGTGVQTTLREVVQVAQKVMRLTVEPAWGSMPDREWDTQTWVADAGKIRRELGWAPRHTFEGGFRKMVEFMAHDGRR